MIKFSKLLTIMLFLFVQLCFLAITPTANATELKFRPQVTIGNFRADIDVVIGSSTETIGKYIRQIYNYAIGAVGIIAVVVMMVGGAIWITSMGNPTKVTEAKNWIAGALTGMVLVMSSYVILKTINPNLVNLPITAIPRISLPEDPEEFNVLTMGADCNPSGADINGHFCAAGLRCDSVTRKCARLPEMEAAAASGKYRWTNLDSVSCGGSVNGCSRCYICGAGGTDSCVGYGEVFCPGSKPAPSYGCCGEFN